MNKSSSKSLFLMKVILFSLALFLVPLTNTFAAGKITTYYKDSSKTKCEFRCSSFVHMTSKGAIYQVNHANNKVNMIDENGKLKWTYKLPENTSPVRGASNYVVDTKGNFYLGYGLEGKYYLASINSKGKLNWRYQLTEYVGPSKPYIAKDGTVYIGSGNPTDYMGPYGESYMYAISSKGKLIWKTKLAGDSINSELKMKSGNLLIRAVPYDDSSITEYTVSTKGKILSKKKVTSTGLELTDKAGNSYSFDYNKNRLVAKNKSGKTIWTYKTKDYLMVEHVAVDGTVYAIEGNQVLAIAKGKVVWKTKLSGYNAIVSSKGLFVFTSEYNEKTDKEKRSVSLLDLKTGKIKATKVVDFSLYSESTVLHPKGYLLVSPDYHIYKISF